MAQGSNNNEAFLGSAMQFLQAGQNMAQQFMDYLGKNGAALGNMPPPVADPVVDPTVDWQRVGAVVASLDQLLAEGDLQAQTLWAESEELLEPVLQDRIEAFRDAMSAFDFEQASQLLQEAMTAVR